MDDCARFQKLASNIARRKLRNGGPTLTWSADDGTTLTGWLIEQVESRRDTKYNDTHDWCDDWFDLEYALGTDGKVYAYRFWMYQDDHTSKEAGATLEEVNIDSFAGSGRRPFGNWTQKIKQLDIDPQRGVGQCSSVKSTTSRSRNAKPATGSPDVQAERVVSVETPASYVPSVVDTGSVKGGQELTEDEYRRGCTAQAERELLELARKTALSRYGLPTDVDDPTVKGWIIQRRLMSTGEDHRSYWDFEHRAVLGTDGRLYKGTCDQEFGKSNWRKETELYRVMASSEYEEWDAAYLMTDMGDRIVAERLPKYIFPYTSGLRQALCLSGESSGPPMDSGASDPGPRVEYASSVGFESEMLRSKSEWDRGLTVTAIRAFLMSACITLVICVALFVIVAVFF
ncbi:hypothetical protein [Nocardia cyriacigeorgica]|uniref:hypothetical protein n=1 Tax=Nocardia cyriacigeorgica TaxID=135487 RepID=UPI0011D2A5D2|nr:hypothetical protein [Nocardia cyriacigeorgica]